MAYTVISSSRPPQLNTSICGRYTGILSGQNDGEFDELLEWEIIEHPGDVIEPASYQESADSESSSEASSENDSSSEDTAVGVENTDEQDNDGRQASTGREKFMFDSSIVEPPHSDPVSSVSSGELRSQPLSRCTSPFLRGIGMGMTPIATCSPQSITLPLDMMQSGYYLPKPALSCLTKLPFDFSSSLDQQPGRPFAISSFNNSLKTL